MNLKQFAIIILSLACVFALPLALRSLGLMPFQSAVLTVDAGPDINATGIPGQSTPVTLNGTVRENGALQPGLEVQWSKVSGPGELTVERLAGGIANGHHGWEFHDLSVRTPRSEFTLNGRVVRTEQPTELDLSAGGRQDPADGGRGCARRGRR